MPPAKCLVVDLPRKGIDIPDGDCGLRCGDQLLHWETGKCLIFNDYLNHVAWNRTDRQRIVLIIDLWHPQLSLIERETLKGLHQYAGLYADNLPRY